MAFMIELTTWLNAQTQCVAAPNHPMTICRLGDQSQIWHGFPDQTAQLTNLKEQHPILSPFLPHFDEYSKSKISFIQENMAMLNKKSKE
jgi:hypothetical protein